MSNYEDRYDSNDEGGYKGNNGDDQTGGSSPYDAFEDRDSNQKHNSRTLENDRSRSKPWDRDREKDQDRHHRDYKDRSMRYGRRRGMRYGRGRAGRDDYDLHRSCDSNDEGYKDNGDQTGGSSPYDAFEDRDSNQKHNSRTLQKERSKTKPRDRDRVKDQDRLHRDYKDRSSMRYGRGRGGRDDYDRHRSCDSNDEGYKGNGDQTGGSSPYDAFEDRDSNQKHNSRTLENDRSRSKPRDRDREKDQDRHHRDYKDWSMRYGRGRGGRDDSDLHRSCDSNDEGYKGNGDQTAGSSPYDAFEDRDFNQKHNSCTLENERSKTKPRDRDREKDQDRHHRDYKDRSMRDGRGRRGRDDYDHYRSRDYESNNEGCKGNGDQTGGYSPYDAFEDRDSNQKHNSRTLENEKSKTTPRDRDREKDQDRHHRDYKDRSMMGGRGRGGRDDYHRHRSRDYESNDERYKGNGDQTSGSSPYDAFEDRDSNQKHNSCTLENERSRTKPWDRGREKDQDRHHRDYKDRSMRDERGRGGRDDYDRHRSCDYERNVEGYKGNGDHTCGSSLYDAFEDRDSNQKGTRHARRVYVGGLPPMANEQTIATFFSRAMAAIGGNSAGAGDAVVNVYINHEKKFAYVEMRSVEEASNAMSLDGIIFDGVSVRVRRPTDYNSSLAAALGLSQPSPGLNLSAVGLTPGAFGGVEGPDRLFFGGLPYDVSELVIRELLESFGTLRGFDLFKDRYTGNSEGYGFCVYQDPGLTDIVCATLNGLKIDDKTLTVRRATASSGQTKDQEPILQQAQQHLAMQEVVLQASGANLPIINSAPLEPPTKVVCLTEHNSRTLENERSRTKPRDRDRDKDQDRHHRDYEDRSTRDGRRRGGRDDYDCYRSRDYERHRDTDRDRYRRRRHRSRSYSRDRSRNRSRSRSRSRSKRYRDTGRSRSRLRSRLRPRLKSKITYGTPLLSPTSADGIPMRPAQAETQEEAMLHVRRILVSGFPSTEDEQDIVTFFNAIMDSTGRNTSRSGDAILHVRFYYNRGFACLYMRSVEEAQNAMSLDGLRYKGHHLRIGRPHDYNPTLARVVGASQPSPCLDLSRADFTPDAVGIVEGPDRLFVGGLPLSYTEEDTRMLLERIGKLSDFYLVKNKNNVSKGYGYCAYVDRAATDCACTILHGERVEDNCLTVRRTTLCDGVPKRDDNLALMMVNYRLPRPFWFERYIHSDGSFEKNVVAGHGAIFRDQYLHCLGILMTRSFSVKTSPYHEWKALKYAMQWGIRCYNDAIQNPAGPLTLVFFVDLESICEILYRNARPKKGQDIQRVVSRIQFLMQGRKIKIRWCKRRFNRPADIIARAACDLDEGYEVKFGVGGERALPGLWDAVEADRNDCFGQVEE